MRNLLLSSATLLLVPAVSVATPDFPSHTHTYTPIELEPISDIPASLKLAPSVSSAPATAATPGLVRWTAKIIPVRLPSFVLRPVMQQPPARCRIIFTTAARTTTPIIGAVAKTKCAPARKPVTFFPATTDIFWTTYSSARMTARIKNASAIPVTTMHILMRRQRPAVM